MLSQQSIRRSMLAAGSIFCVGCSSLTNSDLPSGTADPATYKTVAGALGLRNQALVSFASAISSVIRETALLTDEMMTTQVNDAADQRTQVLQDGIYNYLQGVRNNAGLAIAALSAYAPNVTPAARAEMYAVSGYAHLLLADAFCSGIPLSTFDFEGDFTYRAGSTTAQVYQAAIAQFDSAISFAGDSARILNLARVGKGRTLVAMGDYAGAALAVADVPDTFKYQLAFAAGEAPYGVITSSSNTVSDHEGGNGLPFVSSGDPRTAVSDVGGVSVPLKYPVTGKPKFTIADGIEARLIEAEAALRSGDVADWLQRLNTLRTSCAEGDPCPAPEPAGTGGVEGLPLLSDPGVGVIPPGKTAADVRLDLMMRERASWLFLTAHRQGDLRRLIRNDHRLQQQVYPVGIYQRGLNAATLYGDGVNFPISTGYNDEGSNPLYHGCFNRDA